MPNDYPLAPPKNANKHLDKRMISPPTEFRHLAHMGPKTDVEIELIKSSPNVIEAANETNYYMRPSSSNNSIAVRPANKQERLGLDSAFPVSENPDKFGSIRSYENKPSSHVYENLGPSRPSTKKYKAPPPPIPPQKELKPKLVYSFDDEPPVVFRNKSTDKQDNLELEEAEPYIGTAQRIKQPKPNSVILDRPGLLNFGGDQFKLGLDDCIPVSKKSTPLKTESPILRPLPASLKKQPITVIETPILSSSSPPPNENIYMSTIRSTSAQGKEILDDLDDFLDQLDEEEKAQISQISTDESGYPTLASAKDRTFMKQLLAKYEVNAEPGTIRVRRTKNNKLKPAPPIPKGATPRLGDAPIAPFVPDRPVSMPVPNRPPPSYDAPSFDAPAYDPANSLRNGRAFTKQNALDLRSTTSSDDGVPLALQKYLNEKEMRRGAAPIGKNTTISSGFTEYSTTSSRFSNSQLSDILSNVGEEDEKEEEKLEKVEEIETIPLNVNAPVPLPRTRKLISTPIEENSKPQEKTKMEVEELSKKDEVNCEEVTVICDEFVVHFDDAIEKNTENEEEKLKIEQKIENISEDVQRRSGSIINHDIELGKDGKENKIENKKKEKYEEEEKENEIEELEITRF